MRFFFFFDLSHSPLSSKLKLKAVSSPSLVLEEERGAIDKVVPRSCWKLHTLSTFNLLIVSWSVSSEHSDEGRWDDSGNHIVSISGRVSGSSFNERGASISSLTSGSSFNKQGAADWLGLSILMSFSSSALLNIRLGMALWSNLRFFMAGWTKNWDGSKCLLHNSVFWLGSKSSSQTLNHIALRVSSLGNLWKEMSVPILFFLSRLVWQNRPGQRDAISITFWL